MVVENGDSSLREVSEILTLIKGWVSQINNRPLNKVEREELIKLLTK